MSEEASKLRANAASSIIQKKIELIDIDEALNSFRLTSKDVKGLYTSEFKNLLEIGNRISNMAQQLKSVITITFSAISASVYPANCSPELALMIDGLEDVIKHLIKAQSELSKFRENDEFEKNKSVISTTLDTALNANKRIKCIVDQLGKLLFG